jgi:putative membrane protein insertion efficiency factor
MRKRIIAASAVAIGLLVADASRAPADQLSARAAVSAIHLYQSTLSPLYERVGIRCRFTPTCSHYGEACVRQFGVARGGWLAMKRVLRCGPWTAAGTADPVPAA